MGAQLLRCARAARHDQCEVLLWIRAHPGAPGEQVVQEVRDWSTDDEGQDSSGPPVAATGDPWAGVLRSLVYSARHLPLVGWLRAQTPPCPWDERVGERGGGRALPLGELSINLVVCTLHAKLVT